MELTELPVIARGHRPGVAGVATESKNRSGSSRPPRTLLCTWHKTRSTYMYAALLSHQLSSVALVVKHRGVTITGGDATANQDVQLR